MDQIQRTPVAATGLLAALFALMTCVTQSFATDSVEIKIKDKVEDAKTDLKKAGRQINKGARKVTGTNTKWKDVKDDINDVTDDIDNAAQKAKNRIEEKSKK